MSVYVSVRLYLYTYTHTHTNIHTHTHTCEQTAQKMALKYKHAEIADFIHTNISPSLHLASLKGDLDGVRTALAQRSGVLRRKVDVQARDYEGNTALCAAAIGGSRQVFENSWHIRLYSYEQARMQTHARARARAHTHTHTHTHTTGS